MLGLNHDEIASIYVEKLHRHQAAQIAVEDTVPRVALASVSSGLSVPVWLPASWQQQQQEEGTGNSWLKLFGGCFVFSF